MERDRERGEGEGRGIDGNEKFLFHAVRVCVRLRRR